MKEEVCNKTMNFQECELAILRAAVDKAETRLGKMTANSSEVKKIITIVENFLRQKKLICYGGTAINNILPKQDQFYDKEVEIPDYDFYSPDALQDAKDLTDIYYKNGFDEVEAKPGVHAGTYKVFVNFIPVADITALHKDIYKAIKKDAIRVAGIYYAPANFLRMSMFLELSRPAGDVSRWEKVLKRLTLLNKNYPLKAHQCESIDFQREMDKKNDAELIYETVKNTFIDQGVVFFGGYAISLYSDYMPHQLKKRLQKVADFDVLSVEPQMTAQILKERLEDEGIKHVKIIAKPAIGEIVAPHYQINVGADTVAFIYKPIACHSYNIITIGRQQVKIATIDTMLSFYLAFLYSGRNYYDNDRILCMAQYLFRVQQQNRLKQKGLLKRFSINCYGHQMTLEEMRAEKAAKFIELKNTKNTKEYEEWFLRYRPVQAEEEEKKPQKRKKEIKNSKIKIMLPTKRKRMIREKTRKRGRGGLFV
uniref:Poly(A) polymerase catalytic subunit domain-containing protein n=1 Tax=viral metagenome TaxID=1070528 RepID=A0A6C0B9I2_9ZZZZ